jgi:hypothetical protein
MPDRTPRSSPQPDPLPGPPNSMLLRFRRIMKWMALVSIVVAAIAVIRVASGDEGVHVHMMIATALGAGLTVMLAAALMTLAFLSSSSGHDEHSMRPEDEQ